MNYFAIGILIGLPIGGFFYWLLVRPGVTITEICPQCERKQYKGIVND